MQHTIVLTDTINTCIEKYTILKRKVYSRHACSEGSDVPKTFMSMTVYFDMHHGP